MPRLSEWGQMAHFVAREELDSWWRSLRDERPKVINFQVNDICNAKCVMCNIWTKKRGNELAPEELAALLRDPYFAHVEHVGITGGEPTIRADLPSFYAVMADTLPCLKGASFITNGFLSDRAVTMYVESHRMLEERGIGFSGMVSIDGVGAIHDRVRGKRGAFERAIHTLFGLRDQGVPVIACCTIVRENVYHLHDLLDWARDHGVYVRFRVAEFINRLYNENLTDQIRAFDAYERRHLVAFLHLLLAEYEQEEPIRRTYTSVLSILTGGKRLTRCPYQSPLAINLDSQGRFAHCAPKGTPRALSERRSLTSLAERVTIRTNECANCIHDYHAEWGGMDRWLEQSRPEYDQRLYGWSDTDFSEEEAPTESLDLTRMRSVLLVGWYGTETAGDIAILSGIMQEYLRANSGLQFTIFSLFPHYTRLTLAEMEPALASRAEVRPYHGAQAVWATERCDAIVMAGGPLMDIPQTGMIAALFRTFAARGRPRVVEGCGIGPLHVPDYRRNVLRVVRLATQVAVRDEASRELLRSYGIAKEIAVRDDPSRSYILGTGIRYRGVERVIRCFLRELTAEYPQAVTPAEATRALTELLRNLLAWYPEHRIELLAMHYFPVGNDDRLYARQLVEAIGETRLTYEHRPLTPAELLQKMAHAELCICMRFHSVVFASTIGAPFLAIDYTAGGKIYGYLADAGMLRRLVTLENLPVLTRDTFAEALEWHRDLRASAT